MSLIVLIGAPPMAVLATSFVATTGRILRFVRKHQSPYIAKLYRPSAEVLARNSAAQGEIRLWYPA